MSCICLKHTFLNFKDEQDDEESQTSTRRQRSRSQDVGSGSLELPSSQVKHAEKESTDGDWSSSLLARYAEVLKNPSRPFTSLPFGPRKSIGQGMKSISSCPAISSLVEEGSTQDASPYQTYQPANQKLFIPRQDSLCSWSTQASHRDGNDDILSTTSRSNEVDDPKMVMDKEQFMSAAPNRRPPGRFIHTVSSCPAISSLVEEDSSSIDEEDIRPASEGSDHDMAMGITEHCEPAAPCSRPPRPPGRFMVDENGTTSVSTGEEVRPTSTGNVMDDAEMLMVIKEHKVPAVPCSRPPGRFMPSISSCPALSSMVSRSGSKESVVTSVTHEDDTPVMTHEDDAVPCSRPPGKFMISISSCPALSSMVSRSASKESVVTLNLDESVTHEDDTPVMTDEEHLMPAANYSRPPGRFIHSISSCPSISSLVEQDNMQNVSPYLVPQCDLVAQNRGMQQADNNHIKAREDVLSPETCRAPHMGQIGPGSRGTEGDGTDSSSPQPPGSGVPNFTPLHTHVPKSKNLAEEYGNPKDGSQLVTTLMIRNIPNQYSRRHLIEELEKLGFGGTYDFLYLPMDNGTLSNVGYAFINFVDPSGAKRAMAVFKSYRWKRYRKQSGKMGTVSVAHIQGLENNLKHYENAAVKGARSGHRPMVIPSMQRALQVDAVAYRQQC